MVKAIISPTVTYFESSNIIKAEYIASLARLTITFKNGNVYEYTTVPMTVFTGLVQSPSQGKYFNEHIKPNFINYEKVYKLQNSQIDNILSIIKNFS